MPIHPLDDSNLQALFSDAIRGAFLFGNSGGPRPPADHWLTEWYNRGQQVAEIRRAKVAEEQPWLG